MREMRHLDQHKETIRKITDLAFQIEDLIELEYEACNKGPLGMTLCPEGECPARMDEPCYYDFEKIRELAKKIAWLDLD